MDLRSEGPNSDALHFGSSVPSTSREAFNVARTLARINELQSAVGLGEQDLRCIHDFVRTADAKAQVQFLSLCIEELTTIHRQSNIVAGLFDERAFLLSSTTLPQLEMLLRGNLIQIHEAVLCWRKRFSLPFPLILSGRNVLFDLLLEVRADIETFVAQRSAVSLVCSTASVPPSEDEAMDNDLMVAAVSNSSPPPAAVKASAVKRRKDKFLVQAEALLANSGHFPYSLSSELSSSSASQPKGDAAAVPSQYIQALQYLCSEHQKQISFCRKRFELAQQKRYLPVIDLIARVTGPVSLSEPMATKELADSSAALRAIVHMFTNEEKVQFSLFYEPLLNKSVNVKAFFGVTTVKHLPLTVQQIGKSNASIVDQMRMLSVYCIVRRAFSKWVMHADLKSKERSVALFSALAARIHLKLRLVCWYRFLSIRQQTNKMAAQRSRRKSFAARSAQDNQAVPSSVADVEPFAFTWGGALNRSVSPPELSALTTSIEGRDASTDGGRLVESISCGVQIGGGKRITPFIKLRK